MPTEILRHPVSGVIERLTEIEFLNLFDESVHNAVMAAVARYRDAEALVCFRVLDMCSSQFGHTTALVVGPSNTFQLSSITQPGFRLGDVPSRFAYPVAYVDYRTPTSHTSKE